MGLSLARAPGVQWLVECSRWWYKEEEEEEETVVERQGAPQSTPPDLIVVEVRPEVHKKVT